MTTRDLWIKGLEHLVNRDVQKSQYDLIREKK